MKKIVYIFVISVFLSCTSNTIFEKPKDLIPRDTMSLLIQELMIASSAKYAKNKYLQKDINYMPLVYKEFKIDSTRFKSSNLYYMSQIDLYQEILTDAKSNLEKRVSVFKKAKTRIDSIRKDSLKKVKKSTKENR